MEIKLLSCPLCLQPHFEGVDALRTTLVSVATSHLSCPVCSETLLGLDKLTIHLFGHVNNVAKPPQQDNVHEQINKNIDIISKRCSGKSEVQGEESLENDATDGASTTMKEEVIKCDICTFSFTDKNILDMHQKLLHQTTPDQRTGNYSYHCHLCTKKFKMRGSLMVHLRVAHYGFQSEIGAKSKKQEATVSRLEESKMKEDKQETEVKHVKVLDNKQWECDVCSKMFTTKYFLKKHKRLHTGEMPYCCTLCNKSFTFQQSYHKHMLYHSSEKPYMCNECGRAFKELSTLQNHARIHSGERPFGCETCGKRFRQRVSYLVHRRIHTGVMPYKCTACDKSFRYKVSQRSHKCPMNPPGSVIWIPDTEKLAETNVPSSNTDQDTGQCIMSVNVNTGNMSFISDEDIANFQKESIVLNNNEQIEIRYNKADLPSAMSRAPIGEERERQGERSHAEGNSSKSASGSQNNSDDLDKISSYANPDEDLFSMMLSPILPEVESLCLNNSPNGSPASRQDAINAMGEKCLEEFLYGPN
ncbi:hypothetical protein NQ315_016297 [Exocentrus adspersus]|uniref:C2H2-type domain-containing protein n=1 Tax=Exocentrus adspersus TaxID=1586481 RepID=A0AAV8VP92_9CUCU|nr:hypothetical protein NQ315_016297 [Exocentrus adspersus]